MDKRYIKPDGSIVWVHKVVAPLTLFNDGETIIFAGYRISQFKALEKL